MPSTRMGRKRPVKCMYFILTRKVPTVNMEFDSLKADAQVPIDRQSKAAKTSKACSEQGFEYESFNKHVLAQPL